MPMNLIPTRLELVNTKTADATSWSIQEVHIESTAIHFDVTWHDGHGLEIRKSRYSTSLHSLRVLHPRLYSDVKRVFYEFLVDVMKLPKGVLT